VYYWLGEQPRVVLPEHKEPSFFSADERWERGIGWYSAMFAEVPAGALTGEASTGYTDPGRAALAATRIRSVVPHARLICVLRNPVDRARSHYRHEVQRGRESRSFRAAADPASSYVQRGRYAECLAPYLEHFPREQLCIVRTEDLGDADGPAWTRILDHVGLPAASAVDGGQRRHNVTEAKGQFSKPASALFDRGWLKLGSSLPAPVRRLGRRLLIRDDEEYRELLATSSDEPTDESAAILADGQIRLRQLLGPDAPTWP
jgi:hypothetical protein